MRIIRKPAQRLIDGNVELTWSYFEVLEHTAFNTCHVDSWFRKLIRDLNVFPSWWSLALLIEGYQNVFHPPWYCILQKPWNIFSERKEWNHKNLCIFAHLVTIVSLCIRLCSCILGSDKWAWGREVVMVMRNRCRRDARGTTPGSTPSKGLNSICIVIVLSTYFNWCSYLYFNLYCKCFVFAFVWYLWHLAQHLQKASTAAPFVFESYLYYICILFVSVLVLWWNCICMCIISTAKRCS